jgi:hypothetical protein
MTIFNVELHPSRTRNTFLDAYPELCSLLYRIAQRVTLTAGPLDEWDARSINRKTAPSRIDTDTYPGVPRVMTFLPPGVANLKSKDPDPKL